MSVGTVVRRLVLAFFLEPDSLGCLTPVGSRGASGLPVKGRSTRPGKRRSGGISNTFCSGISSKKMGTPGGGGVLFGSKRSESGSVSLWGDGVGERFL